MSLIVSLLEATNNNMGKIFAKPPEDKKEEHKRAKDKFKHKYGDHLSILNIMQQFKKQKKEDKKKDWCFKNFLNYKNLTKALKNSYRLQNNPLNESKQNNMKIDDRILFCLSKGLETKTANLESNNFYKTKYTNKTKISRQSYIKKNVSNIIFNELFIQNDKELNIVSKKF